MRIGLDNSGDISEEELEKFAKEIAAIQEANRSLFRKLLDKVFRRSNK